jgi:hypothetical protein
MTYFGVDLTIRTAQYNPAGADVTVARANFVTLYENIRAKCLNELPETTDDDLGYFPFAIVDPATVQLGGTGGSFIQRPWVTFPQFLQYKTSQIMAYDPTTTTGGFSQRINVAGSEFLNSGPGFQFVHLHFSKGHGNTLTGGIRSLIYSTPATFSAFTTVNPVTTPTPSFCRQNVNNGLIRFNTERITINGQIFPTNFPPCPAPVQFMMAHDLQMALIESAPVNQPCTNF